MKELKLRKGTAERIRAEQEESADKVEAIRAKQESADEAEAIRAKQESADETEGIKRCCDTCEWYRAVDPQSAEKHCVSEYEPSACMECVNWEQRGTAETETVKKETVYLAGKITGDPCYFSKFYEAQKKLEAGGFIVLNPAMLPGEGFSHEAYMRMSAAMLAECGAVCFLPDWKESRGATYEYGRAAALGKRIFFFDEWKNGGINESF